MYSYKLNPALTAEHIAKIVAQVPGQAGAMIQAMAELSKDKTDADLIITEDAIVKHIQDNLARLTPRAKDKSVVPGFVAYYRAMLGKLPATWLEQYKGASKRTGGGGGKAAQLIDPITGEVIENVFVRPPVKNPGSRKAGKKVEHVDDGEVESEELAEFDDTPAEELPDAEEMTEEELEKATAPDVA